MKSYSKDKNSFLSDSMIFNEFLFFKHPYIIYMTQIYISLKKNYAETNSCLIRPLYLCNKNKAR